MSKKITIIVAAMAALTLTGMTPATLATHPHDDEITRTWGAIVLAEKSFKGDGTGIYDYPTNNQVCPIATAGLRAVLSDMHYHQKARIDFNLKTGTVPVSLVGQIAVSLGMNCPLPGANSGIQHIVIDDFNVAGPYNSVKVDQLLCTKESFVTCFPDPTTGLMEVGACPAGSSVFSKTTDDKNILGNQGFLSREIDCISDWQHITKYYHGSSHCSTFSFGEDGWGTAFCRVQNNDIVPYGVGSSYLTSCMSIGYMEVDRATGTSTPRTSLSHDYKLILDLATPSDWNGTVATHMGNLLQGWHDLGGQNHCPWSMGGGTAFNVTAKKEQGPVEQYHDLWTPLIQDLGVPGCADTRDNDDDGGIDMLGGLDDDGNFVGPDDECSSPVDQESS